MLDRLRHELRALGIGTLGLPILAAAIFLGVSLLAGYDVRQTSHSDAQAHHDIALGLLFLLEFGLPPVAGIAAANLVASNPAVELHLTLRRSYAGVMWLRLALFVAWVALAAAGASALILAAGYWLAPQTAPRSQLIWAAPTLWFVGAGAVLSLLLRSRAAAGAVLGMIWLGELFFRYFFLQNAVLQKLYLFLTLETLPNGVAPDASYWLANRLTLFGTGLVFLAATALLLRRNEALLGHEA
jgi:hypothetical protein